MVITIESKVCIFSWDADNTCIYKYVLNASCEMNKKLYEITDWTYQSFMRIKLELWTSTTINATHKMNECCRITRLYWKHFKQGSLDQY